MLCEKVSYIFLALFHFVTHLSFLSLYPPFHFFPFLFWPPSLQLPSSSRYAANSDAKEGKEWQENGKEGTGLDQNRPMSVMSSLSYRKRSNLKDSLGGKGDEGSLFSTLKEQDDSQELSSFRKSKAKQPVARDSYSVNSWAKDDLDDRGSVISQAYSEAASRARKGMDSRWSEIDNKSVVSSMGPSRASWLDDDDDAKSSISAASMLSRCRSMSRLDERQSERGSAVSPSLSCRSPGSVSRRSPGSVSRADSRISLARSCRLSEFDIDDDARSVAYSEFHSNSYSPHHSSSGRSMSVPPQTRTTDSDLPDASDLKPVSHRNYLDPALEAAINEVLNFKPIKFKRSSLEDSEAETSKPSKRGDEEEEDEVKSVRSGRDSSRSSSSLRRSASAVDFHRSSSSLSSRSRKKSKSRKKRSHSSDSSENERRRRRSKKKGKKRKSKKESSSSSSSSSSESQSSSESDSSSGASTISYKSANSVKRAPGRQASASEDEREPGGSSEATPPLGKKEAKKRKKNVDSVMMKYLYRADSD